MIWLEKHQENYKGYININRNFHFLKMPQFDTITFFTQIFWLIIIFFGFYFLSLRIFVPEIAAVLKTRKKKLAIGTGSLSNYNLELSEVEKVTGSILQSSSDVFTQKVQKVIVRLN